MGFQPEAFVRALLRQFNMESAGSLGFEDDMGGIPPELAAEMGFPLGGTGGSQAYPELVILSCRCLSNLIEALPSSTMHIVHADGVQVLVEKLLSIEYIDLAESILSILDKLSGEFPSAVLKGNGLMAALQYIDFFGIHVQRTAISIAANACRGLGSYQNNRTTGEKLNYFLNFFGSSWDLDEKGNGPNALSAVDLVKEIMPILDRLITYSDARLLENAMRCLSRIVEWAHELVLADFESIVTASLLKTLTQIAGPLSTNHPVIFTMLTKILSQIARASDAYAGLLVSEDNILPLIVRCLSGKGDTLVMTSVVSQPPEQIVAILNVASEILPRLPDSENWNLTVPENPALYMTDASTSPRLELLRGTPKVFDQYLIELLPIFISVFGITVNMAIRRKCLECIVKTVWFSPIDALMNAELVSLGKFITDLLGLSQHFIGKSAQDKETAETKSFVAVGLQVAMILLKRDGPKFRTYFRREGVLAEMTKVLDHLVASAASGNAATSSVPVSASRNRSSSSRDMDQVLRNIAEDLSKFEESIGGEANTAGSTALPGVTSETRVSAMVNDMRSAFETLRQEETRASASSGPRKTIKALNEKMFTDVQVQEWMTWLCKDILHSAVSHQDEGQSLVKDLEEIRDVLRMSTRTDLKNMLAVMHCFASLLAGDQKTSGLTGFEIVESGVVEALLVYLTDSAATVQSLENRVLLFYHVFMNSALEDQEAGRFVSGAFESLVTRLQETLSRTESLLVAKAVPQNGSGSSGSVFALLNTLVGMGGSRDPIDNPTLQLARQIRVKLVAADPEDVPKQYQAMTVSVHAVATFRSLEEFLRGRIFISSPAERVLESHDDEDKDEVMEDWEDDEEIGPFDEDGVRFLLVPRLYF